VTKKIPAPELRIERHDSLKLKALSVLELRCNSCHRKQNPFKVFKERNMNKYAAKVYQQVFVLKRMPGDGSKLSESEKKLLLTWLDAIEVIKL